MGPITKTLRAPWKLSHDTWNEGAARMRNADGAAAMVVVTQGTDDNRLAAWEALINAVNAATADERGETPFVIWSNEHRGWWAPKMRGYTSNLDEAGCYSRTGAETICYTAAPSSLHMQRSRDGGLVPAEIMMRLEDARRSTIWYRGNAEVG